MEYIVLRPSLVSHGIDVVRALIYLVIGRGVIVGLTEEVMFRGLLQRSLEHLFPPRQALVMASLQFSLMHTGRMNPLGVIFAYTAGTVFGYLFRRTKSLMAPVIAYGFGNVVLYMIALLT